MSVTLHYCEPLTIEDITKAIPGGVPTQKLDYFLFTWQEVGSRTLGVILWQQGDSWAVDGCYEPDIRNGLWRFRDLLEQAGHKLTYTD